MQHRDDGRGVGPTPVRRVVVQLSALVERDRRTLDRREVDLRVQNQLTACHAEGALEGKERMAHVIEHAEKEHEVERPDPLG